MVECNLEENKEKCNCTYSDCPRKGKCCKCLKYHLSRKELPACCFPSDVEQNYDRSIELFCQINNQQL